MMCVHVCACCILHAHLSLPRKRCVNVPTFAMWFCAKESLIGVPPNMVTVESTMMLHAGRQLGDEDSPRTCRPLAGSFVQCITVCPPVTHARCMHSTHAHSGLQMGDDDWALLEDERKCVALACSFVFAEPKPPTVFVRSATNVNSKTRKCPAGHDLQALPASSDSYGSTHTHRHGNASMDRRV